MNKTIEDILKGMPLDDKAKGRLIESWNTALADAKVAQEATVRHDIKEQYDTDLEKIHEAFGTFLEERIKPHVQDLQEGIAEVDGMKVRYAEKTTKIKEAAKAYIRKRIGAMEQIVEARVHSELSELHEEVVSHRRAALIAITEKKNEMEADRLKFKTKAAKVMAEMINVKVPAQLEPLREDIKAARDASFGREIFEAFQTVFRRQHFNTSSEFAKLVEENSTLKAKTAKIKTTAANAVKESRDAATAAKRAYGKLNESVTRKATMTRLLKPLTGNSRVQMKTLLEATKTDKMDTTFRKALPQIARETQRPARKTKVLSEGKKNPISSFEFHSGSTASNLTESDYDEFDADLADIGKLAGIKKAI